MQSLTQAITPKAPKPLLPLLLHSMAYVNVKMRWKKDPSFDSVPVLSHSRDLRPLLTLLHAASPAGIPVSSVSKRRRSLEVPDRRVASFLRRFPAAFAEFTGPLHGLPWFRLTPAASLVLQEEREAFSACRPGITARLRRVLLMSRRRRRLPLRVAQGLLWHLGLPEDYLRNPGYGIAGDGFEILTFEGGAEDDGKELKLIDDGRDGDPPLSVLQMDAIRRFGSAEVVPFPLFPSKGLRLKRKIGDWLDCFQKLPYVSPYEEFESLNRSSDVLEKRAAGVLHELLSLFVTCSAERRRLLCLRQHLGLPQKFHRVFERHPHVFYLLLKEKTCFVVLKEAYLAGEDTAIEKHPMLEVRKKYVELMDKSREIIRSRRSGKPVSVDREHSEDSAAIVSWR